MMFRVGNSGGLKDSAPCKDCTDVLKKYKIKRVVYSNRDGDIVSQRVSDYNTSLKTKARKNNY